MINTIHTDNAPAAVGPYSQAMEWGTLIFTSGQLGLNPSTGVLEGTDVTSQAHMALRNLSAVLTEAGSSMDCVLKTTCFLANMEDFAVFNAVYGEYFSNKPARSCMAVKDLPKNALVEVEAIAVKNI